MNRYIRRIEKKFSFVFGLSLLLIILNTSCTSTQSITKTNTNIAVAGSVKKKGDNKKLYTVVESWLGVPYKYGGQTKSGTDCSGLVVEIYKDVYGKKLYRSSYEIYEKNCKQIKKNDLKEGDLVFFITSKTGKRINHVGLYLNNNKFVHSSTSKGVIISDLSEAYYERCFYRAGRVIKN